MPDIPTLYLVSSFVAGFVAGLQYFMSRRMGSLTLRIWALANLALCAGHLVFMLRPALPFAFATTLANAILIGGVALMAAGVDAFADRRPNYWEVAAGPVLLVLTFSLSFMLDVDNTGRLFLTTGPLVYYLLRTAVSLLRLTTSRQTAAVRIFCALVLLGFAGLYVVRALAAVAGLLGGGDVITNASGSLIRAGILFVILIWNFCTLYLVLEREASTDALTGLFNRRATQDAGQAVLAATHAEGRPVSVLLMDLDRFKSVNDRFGHAMGDRVLQIFAAVMTKSVRRGDVIGRIGGEEFCVVLPDCDGVAARALAERLRIRCLEALARVDGRPVGTTVSIGIATRRSGDAGFIALLKDADAALYAAKAAGRNRVTAAPDSVAAPQTGPARQRA